MTEGHAGGCLCGAVRYRIDGPLPPPGACHCGQCRRMAGHLAAFCSVEKARLRVEGAPAWYESTPGEVRRGFCPACGSNLFWERYAEDLVDVWIGTLDPPTGLRLAFHIHVADKGDYYDIADGLPQFERGAP